MVRMRTLQLETQGNADIHDITVDVSQAIVNAGIRDGIVTVFTASSTSALTTIEFESGCVADLQRLFDQIIPSQHDYAHNARWGDGNGHSHVRAALLGPSLTIPFSDGKLILGTWQQIVFVDFDNRRRSRQIVVQMIGE